MFFTKVTFIKFLTKKEKITMKTKMKKLISISTIPVLALALLLVLGTVLADDAAPKPAPSLNCTIEYWWMPGWKGIISGDIEAVVIWPGGPTPPKFVGQTSHYVGRFEIWDIDPVLNPDDAVLLLTGEGAGSTTIRHGRDSIWRSNGIVTGASDEFADWIGRRVHQEGHFTWAAPGLPEHGTGTFQVN
jgi:hypothetical protein